MRMIPSENILINFISYIFNFTVQVQLIFNMLKQRRIYFHEFIYHRFVLTNNRENRQFQDIFLKNNVCHRHFTLHSNWSIWFPSELYVTSKSNNSMVFEVQRCLRFYLLSLESNAYLIPRANDRNTLTLLMRNNYPPTRNTVLLPYEN